jgi:rRNA maturation endonuclease Nob1
VPNLAYSFQIEEKKVPHLKCNKCQHEWDDVSPESECGWCGSDGKVLEEKTQFEKFVEEVQKDPKAFFKRIGLKE